jgi:hypothetical protein
MIVHMHRCRSSPSRIYALLRYRVYACIMSALVRRNPPCKNSVIIYATPPYDRPPAICLAGEMTENNEPGEYFAAPYEMICARAARDN